MSKKQEIARSVLELCGGKDNLVGILHCMTRLRIKSKKKELVDIESIKAIKGVYGAQFAEGALQVVIGPIVDEVYQELISLTGLAASEMIGEDQDAPPAKKSITPKSMASGILNTFSSCMTPLIPLFIVIGMVNVIASLVGPTMLNLVSAESHIYTNFSFVGQAITYFLPIFVAITASKHFNCSTMISVALAGLMLHPGMVGALAAEGGYTIYGIPAVNAGYETQIIPILLVVFAQSYIEKLCKKIIPNSIRIVGVPLCTLLIMLPITFCALGPIGFYIGAALTNAVLWLYAVAGPVETMLVGAAIVFLTAFGIGRPIFFACMSVLMTTGVEYAFMGLSMVIITWIVCGVVLGYIIKVRSTTQRQLGITCFAACLLSGVSEPSVFGIILPNRKTYMPVIVSGALSGLFLGMMNVGYYQFGPCNFLGVIGFAGGEPSNFLFGCIASAIAFVSALVLTLLTFKETVPEGN